MNFKAQVHSLIKEEGIQEAAVKVKVSALALVCYAAGYGKPQKRTMEALEKFFSRKGKAKKSSSVKVKAKAKVKAKVAPKAAPKKKAAPKLNSKPAATPVEAPAPAAV